MPFRRSGLLRRASEQLEPYWKMRGMLVLDGELGVPGDFPEVAVSFVYAEGDDGDAGVHWLLDETGADSNGEIWFRKHRHRQISARRFRQGRFQGRPDRRGRANVDQGGTCDDERRIVFSTLDDEPIAVFRDTLWLGKEVAVSYDLIMDYRKS